MATKDHFPRVKKAREALQAKAEQILEQYLQVVKQAQDAGNYEVAAKSLQWLIDHMPEEEIGGGSMVGPSVDKAKPIEQKTGPTVQIGIQLGGINKPKSLPAPVVTSEVIDSE